MEVHFLHTRVGRPIGTLDADMNNLPCNPLCYVNLLSDRMNQKNIALKRRRERMKAYLAFLVKGRLLSKGDDHDDAE